MIYKGSDIDIKLGDLILFYTAFKWYSPETWLSWAIRKFTSCKYTHAGVVVSNWGKLFINEARGKGIIARPIEGYLDRGCKILIRRSVEQINEQDFSVKANSKLGNQYGYYILVVIESIYRLTRKWLGHTAQFAENDKMVCTQYAAWCYGLDNWWLYSDLELMGSIFFQTVYVE